MVCTKDPLPTVSKYLCVGNVQCFRFRDGHRLCVYSRVAIYPLQSVEASLPKLVPHVVHLILSVHLFFLPLLRRPPEPLPRRMTHSHASLVSLDSGTPNLNPISIHSPPLLPFPLKKNPSTNHSTTTTPTIIPASFKIATLFPCCAIRVMRPAEPFIEVDIEEKTSFYDGQLGDMGRGA